MASVANLGEAVEKFLVRSHIRVPDPAHDIAPDATSYAPSCQPSDTLAANFANPPFRPSVSAGPRRLQQSQVRLFRKWELHQHIHLLRSQGLSLHQITKHVGLARNTVRKIARQLIPPLLPNGRQALGVPVCSSRTRGMCRGDGMRDAVTLPSSSERLESRDILEAKPQ
jgi:hypothetical protein